MNSIELISKAKINLALDVLGKRPDGYHDVKMIMQTIPLHDYIEIKKTTASGIKLKTNLPYLPTNEKNLAYRAAEMMCEKFGITDGLYINVEKHIPVSAGMAGGSTNAASVLKGMNAMYSLGLNSYELCEIGLKLGADVPFCILGGTCLSEGIGEKLTRVPQIMRCFCLVVKPNFNLSTEFVYKNLVLDENTIHPDVDGMINALKQHKLKDLCKCMGNVLESVSINAHPKIQQIKEQMLELGAESSLMSGSGPTVFGIFGDYRTASKAYYQFKVGEFGKNTFMFKL